jgi:hypothetical protein
MKKESNTLLKFLSLAGFLGLTLIPSFASAANLSLFDYDRANKIVPNCSLRKEYNYFMNQWTTNEVCNPTVLDVPKISYGNTNKTTQYSGGYDTGGYYVTNIPNSYTAPAANYNGFYTGNNNGNSYNNWNGYGNSSNYLLSSFGGGYTGYSNNYLTSPYYSYGSYYYPNSVAYYTPTIYNSGYSYSSGYYDDTYYKTGNYYPSYDNRYSSYYDSSPVSYSGYSDSSSANYSGYNDSSYGGYSDSSFSNNQGYTDNSSTYSGYSDGY